MYVCICLSVGLSICLHVCLYACVYVWMLGRMYMREYAGNLPFVVCVRVAIGLSLAELDFAHAGGKIQGTHSLAHIIRLRRHL